MIAASNKHVGKKKVDTRVKPGMTTEIKEAIKKRNHLQKTTSVNRKEWRGPVLMSGTWSNRTERNSGRILFKNWI